MKTATNIDLAKPKEAPPIMTKREAAAYLRMCERTLGRYLAEGLLKPMRWGTKVAFRLEELNRFALAMEAK